MTEVYTPPEGPPQGVAPNREIYGIMGNDNIFAMIRDLYRELETSSIRGMFHPDMEAASKRNAAFFVQLLGGPPLYNTRYGKPAMRKRHMAFEIDEAARQVWLSCFHTVLEHPERYDFPQEHLEGFQRFLEHFSRWMVNRA
jgi:hemoglobin